MNRFERLVGRGIDEFESRLQDDGLSADQASQVADLVAELGLPGLLAFVANDGAAGLVGPDLIKDLSGKVASEHRIPQSKVEDTLNDVLIKRTPVAELAASPELQNLVLRAALQGAADGSGVMPSEAELEQAVALLQSGEFFEDVGSSTAAVAYAIPGLPLAVIRDVVRLPFKIPGLTAALLVDLAAIPSQIPGVLGDLIDNRTLDRPPAILSRTLRRLYGFATLATVAETLGGLTSQPSVQLAIVLWARANGLPISQKQIARLDSTLFNTANPNIAPLLPVAWKELGKGLDLAEAQRVLGRLGALG